MTSAEEVISDIRYNREPAAAELEWFAQGLAAGYVSDSQAGAFAMAVCLRGLSPAGRTALSLAMRDSGRIFRWDRFDAPVIDKHSTGGVGDCVTLVLVPAIAACGGLVPKISGRGLGHTGGTLDKLEAISGLETQVSEDQLGEILNESGCAIVGTTADIAPADKRLYAVRDVTATVQSIDLIAASILSKKLAVSPQALVFDVKVGSGAFMKTFQEAQALAQAMTDIANSDGLGCAASALITEMNQPLTPAVGNAVEVKEVIEVLTGTHQNQDLIKVVTALGGEVMANSGLSSGTQDGEARILAAIQDGRAAEKFERMVSAMGGPPNFLEDGIRTLPAAKITQEVRAPSSGYISHVNGELLGKAVVDLGGGRRVEGDTIDPSVGLSKIIRRGEKVDRGWPIALIHAGGEEKAAEAERTVQAAFEILQEPPSAPRLICDRVG
ncbi:MAG: thymidine phosphorylase [Aestuariivita sp.]|nr:thymidine phosphorylase [Aestuariivita sp.]MCY4346956.1 thymidine phosphorylase [Aestuariivita sp.]